MEKSYFDIINERYSCREFENKKITKEEIEKIVEAGILAPTACNFQPQRIVVVEDEKLLEELKNATRFTFDAKTIFVICYDKNESWKRKSDNKDHGDIDAAIVATHMMLAATSLNIGSCYVCSMKEAIAKQILNLPDNLVISCMLPMGYPKNIGTHNTRKSKEDIVIYK